MLDKLYNTDILFEETLFNDGEENRFKGMQQVLRKMKNLASNAEIMMVMVYSGDLKSGHARISNSLDFEWFI